MEFIRKSHLRNVPAGIESTLLELVCPKITKSISNNFSLLDKAYARTVSKPPSKDVEKL